MKLAHFLLSMIAIVATATAHAQLRDYNVATVPLFNSKIPMTASPANSAQRLTTLDVMGIGLSVEMFRQSETWNEMQKHPKGSILAAVAQSEFPTNVGQRDIETENRSADVLEYGASHFVKFWPIPSVSVWPYCYNKEQASVQFPGQTNFAFYYDRVDDLRMPAGMHQHRIASLGSYFRNEPEEILERAFQFFEQNPEAPALLLLMTDGDLTRFQVGDKSRAAFVTDGPRRFDAMAESLVVLVLARRERVDAIRPFAGTPETALYAPGPGKAGFKPSKYVPEPWTAEQIKEFDSLPTIAVLHRPIRLSYRKDKDGKPTFDPQQKASLMPQENRQAAFKDAFDTALKEIPGGHPARVFYDAGGPVTGKNVIPLSLAVHSSLPNLEFGKPDEFYDISDRIGNTGAASPFVQWALAAMTSFDKKDSSVTVNLRQADEAMITVISPSNDKRQHPMGHPFDFNLAPQDGGSAKPVAPPPPTNTPHAGLNSAPIPVAASQVSAPAPVRYVALGARLSSGDECTQAGVWQCSPADSYAGNTHYFPAGRTLPLVRVKRELSTWKKLRGEAEQENVAAAWILMSYDVPNA